MGADEFRFGVHLDRVGQNGAHVYGEVLEHVARRVVDRLLDLPDLDARGVHERVSFDLGVGVLGSVVGFFHGRPFPRLARAILHAYHILT